MLDFLDDAEITFREVLFSIIIFCVMLLIGFMISSNIDNSINSKNKEYSQAMRINDEDMFDYCLNTNVGNAFVEGTLYTSNPVIDDRFDESEFLYERVEHQRYCQHTYTTTDSKGHVTTHIYWSWDYFGHNEYSVDEVEFAGKTFPLSNFDYYNNFSETVSTGFNKRDVVSGFKNNTHGTIYTNIADNNISKGIFYTNCDHDKAIEKAMTNSKLPLITFWFAWIFLTIILIAGFYYLDNKWLE